MSSSKTAQRIKKIQALVRRGEWKKAYKESVFCAKQSADSEVRSLVVSSLWGWIKDMVQKKQFEEAKNQVSELLRLPDIPEEIQNEFPSVFRTLGLNSLLPQEFQQDMSTPEIQVELVDRFLLLGVKSDDLLPENLADAERIESAFAKIEAKQDDDALEQLRSISFRSPLADWRLFLRGLVDHYHKNDVKAEESWRRLSSERPPARIVAKLRNLLQEETNSSRKPGAVSRLFGLFRTQSGSDPTRKTELLDSLRTMDEYLRQERYKELLGRFHSIKNLFREKMPIQYDRLLRIIQHHLMKNASPNTLRQFIDRNLPLPLDPRGNRVLALVSDNLDYDQKFDRPNWLLPPTVYWKTFAEKDVDQIKSFSPKMKARAKAAVYNYIAKETIEEFLSAKDQFDDFERLEEYVNVPRTTQEIDNLLEKAISYDPTYLSPYLQMKKFFLEMHPIQRDKSVFMPPQIVEIDERILKHIPDQKETLIEMFDYCIEANEPEKAESHYKKLHELDPLSRATAFFRYRFCLACMRKGLRDRNFQYVDVAIAELNSRPPIESMLYRFDLIPLALMYINDVLQEKDDTFDDYCAIAKRLGIEKKAPLILAILAEGVEIGLPRKDFNSLESEWEKTINGRCNGNVAGTIGDVAFNMFIASKRYTKSKRFAQEAAAYVNRAGQVKWNSEKDLFGACNLLWFLTVENTKKDRKIYEKTYRNLVKKGLKQFPNSLFFLFFNAETYFLDSSWRRYFAVRSTLEKYQEFFQQVSSVRNDPQYESFVRTAEFRINELSHMDFSSGFPYRGSSYDEYDDDDDDDWDEDKDWDEENDAPGSLGLFENLPPLPEVPPEILEDIRQHGGLPPSLREKLLSSFPDEIGPFRNLIVDVFEECMLKGIPTDQFEKILFKKMESVLPFGKLDFISSMIPDEDENGVPEIEWREDDEDEDEDDNLLPGFRRNKSTKKSSRHRKNKKK